MTLEKVIMHTRSQSLEANKKQSNSSSHREQHHGLICDVNTGDGPRVVRAVLVEDGSPVTCVLGEAFF